MPFAVLFLLAAGAASIAVLYPHLRAFALLVSAIFGAILAYVAVDEFYFPDGPPQLIAPEEVVLSDLRVREGSRFVRLEGRVENLSPRHHLRSLDLRVRIYDCPEVDSPREECATIADDTGIARVDVPAGQVRTFSAILRFADQPPVTGVVVWDHEIAAIQATEN